MDWDKNLRKYGITKGVWAEACRRAARKAFEESRAFDYRPDEGGRLPLDEAVIKLMEVSYLERYKDANALRKAFERELGGRCATVANVAYLVGRVAYDQCYKEEANRHTLGFWDRAWVSLDSVRAFYDFHDPVAEEVLDRDPEPGADAPTKDPQEWRPDKLDDLML